jgi:hydroxyacylglutathione hydrolase
VFDVRRDVDMYFEEARRQGMRSRYAADSHQHNDYLTGICELPERAGEVPNKPNSQRSRVALLSHGGSL